jgi:phage baseplate assembly protein W
MSEPIGVKVPIRMGKTGFFDQTFSSIEEAKSNMINLLLTRKGERPMQPDFGTNIYNHLFSQMTGDLSNKIQQEITSAVNTWLPYIELLTVKVDTSPTNMDQNKIDIRVDFGLKRNIKEHDEIIITFVI